MLMKHVKSLLSQQVGSWGQQRPSGEQQTAVAQSMTNTLAIVTTVAPTAVPFIGRWEGDPVHSNLGSGRRGRVNGMDDSAALKEKRVE